MVMGAAAMRQEEQMLHRTLHTAVDHQQQEQDKVTTPLAKPVMRVMLVSKETHTAVKQGMGAMVLTMVRLTVGTVVMLNSLAGAAAGLTATRLAVTATTAASLTATVASLTITLARLAGMAAASLAATLPKLLYMTANSSIANSSTTVTAPAATLALLLLLHQPYPQPGQLLAHPRVVTLLGAGVQQLGQQQQQVQMGQVCLSRSGLCLLLPPLMRLHPMVLCSISGRVGAHPISACRAGLGHKGMWWMADGTGTEALYRDGRWCTLEA